MTRARLRSLLFLLLGVSAALLAGAAAAVTPALPRITIGAGPASGPQEVSTALQVLALLTVLSLAPAILLLMTPFTRIVIVFSFLRQALGTQSIPPNQVLVGLALFLTFFIMRPVGEEIHAKALRPYLAGNLGWEAAVDRAAAPVRKFLFAQTQERDLALFVSLSKSPRPRNRDEVPFLVLVPSFVISELRTAFTMGFLLFIPFLVIDMVVASTLMAMGMLMLPPITISLPFKVLLFVLVDGWHLIVRSLAENFRT